MLMRRSTRRALAWLCAIAFAWLQLATAAYACPARNGDIERMLESLPACESMSVLTMDGEQPNLCKAHCDNDKQRANADQGVEVPQVGAIDFGPILREAGFGAVAPRPARSRNTGPPAGTPPLFITYLVLRN